MQLQGARAADAASSEARTRRAPHPIQRYDEEHGGQLRQQELRVVREMKRRRVANESNLLEETTGERQEEKMEGEEGEEGEVRRSSSTLPCLASHQATHTTS